MIDFQAILKPGPPFHHALTLHSNFPFRLGEGSPRGRAAVSSARLTRPAPDETKHLSWAPPCPERMQVL